MGRSIQQPEYASKIVDLKPDSDVYKKLIQNLNADKFGHVNKPSADLIAEKGRFSGKGGAIDHAGLLERSGREVVAIGNSLYKPVTPESVPDEFKNIDDFSGSSGDDSIPETFKTNFNDKYVDLEWGDRTLTYFEDIHNPGQYITIYGRPPWDL